GGRGGGGRAGEGGGVPLGGWSGKSSRGASSSQHRASSDRDILHRAAGAAGPSSRYGCRAPPSHRRRRRATRRRESPHSARRSLHHWSRDRYAWSSYWLPVSRRWLQCHTGSRQASDTRRAEDAIMINEPSWQRPWTSTQKL